MKRQRRIVCSFCNGTSQFYYTGRHKDVKECHCCNGKGILIEVTTMAYETITKDELPYRKHNALS